MSIANIEHVTLSSRLMCSHVQKTTSVCFTALRQLRQIRHSVPSSIPFRLDFQPTSFVASGCPECISRTNPSVSHSDHISNSLVSLHWLYVLERIVVLVYKVHNGLAPCYLRPLTGVADLPGRCTLRSFDTNRLHTPPVRLSMVDINQRRICSPLLIYQLREDERLSWRGS